MWRLKIADGSDPLLDSVNDHIGRQHWEFDEEAGTPEERAQIDRVRQEFKEKRKDYMAQSADLLMRMQLRKENEEFLIPQGLKVKENEEITEEAVKITLKRGINYFCSLQAHDGHWPAENAGPFSFLPPLIIALHITGAINTVLTPQHQIEIKRYIYLYQNEDGGWAVDTQAEQSSMFTTVLNYISLRLLGEGPDDGENNAMSRARQWILDHGGAIGILSWGKAFLAVLGLYEWDGCNPMGPEFWLLPKIPGLILCLTRTVYLPMSYLYGRRFVAPITQLILSLRTELFKQPYHEINWNKAKNTFAKEDVMYPHPLIQDILWGFLYHIGEPIMKCWPFSKLREKAMKKAMELIHYEDINSRYLCAGCTEKSPSLLACWVEDPNSEAYKKHLARIPDYLWLAEDGMKMQSIGSQWWDAAFTIQAIFASGLAHEYGPTLKKAHDFVKASQVRDNPSGNFKKMYRHISKGSWTFATQDHGWQVADCTAEGVLCALLLSTMPPEIVGEKMEAERLYDAVNILLSLQSKNGGFTAWEPNLAYRWLEKFNPMEFAQDVLIEREYMEVTSCVIHGLTLFNKFYPKHRTKEVENSIANALRYVEQTQNPDGSWTGIFLFRYTYGTWLGVHALVACGKNYNNSVAVRKGCDFLLSKQLPDGGWAEKYVPQTCTEYVNLEGNRSNLVQTSCALLSLIKAGYGEVDPTPIEKGIKLLINSQMEDGDFPQQEFNGLIIGITLNYALFRNIYPIWALGEYRQLQAKKSNFSKKD
ncbi:unnamed protein product [Amaranthus hypochondriacus]